MGLCQGRSPVRRPRPARSAVLLLAHRSGEHPNRHLAGYAGILQADAYAGFGDPLRCPAPARPDHRGGLLEPWPAQILRCWPTSANRRWPSKRCGALTRSSRSSARSTCRRRAAAPVARNGSGRSSARSRMDALRTRPAVASRRDRQGHGLMLKRWPPSPAFSTTAASAYRTTLSSARCAGSLSGAAHGCSPAPTVAVSERLAMYTLIATAKLNSVDPQAWLADVLRRIADHPASRLHELLP